MISLCASLILQVMPSRIKLKQNCTFWQLQNIYCTQMYQFTWF